VKMGVFSAFNAMKPLSPADISGIIVGTGFGGFEKAEIFLTSLLVNQEKILSPTPFTQSLHSAVAGQIALELKCFGYTMTYTQRGFSFEDALVDAWLAKGG
jgi:3-oxoacyl-[acyl-carrier-protein] synthase II